MPFLFASDPWESTPKRRAAVRGAGPAGLAAAITLAKEGWAVQVAALRSRTAPLRTARIVLRNNAVEHLQHLGVLVWLEEHHKISCVEQLDLIDEDKDLKILSANVHFTSPEYDPKLHNFVPVWSISVADLEEALAIRALALGVVIHEESTMKLTMQHDEQKYRATLMSKVDAHEEVDFGVPDLIVCASGKGDQVLLQELGVQRYHAISITEASLPVASKADGASRFMNFASNVEGEMETQSWVNIGIMRLNVNNKPESRFVFDIKDTSQHGVEQMLCDFIFVWPAARDDINQDDHVFITSQIPRGMPQALDEMQKHALKKVNHYLGTTYKDFQELANHIPLPKDKVRSVSPVIVETCSLPTYVFGKNLIVIGDAAASDSPVAGFGADAGFHHDSKSLAILAQRLKHVPDGEIADEDIESALDDFNIRRARTTLEWVDGCRHRYITAKEAERIVEAIKAREKRS